MGAVMESDVGTGRCLPNSRVALTCIRVQLPRPPLVSRLQSILLTIEPAELSLLMFGRQRLVSTQAPTN